MKQPQSLTPDDVDIRGRNRRHELADILATDWHGGDPLKTCFFNAMSILFPIGERYFVDAVRRFRDQISDPKLLREVDGFSAQEAIHAREHQRLNEALCAARGYDLQVLESRIQCRQQCRSDMPAIVHLAATAAYEHYTAMLADALLRNPAMLEGAHPVMADMWRWHAIEEIEHKSVAFDVFRAVGGTDKLRRQIMLYATRSFFSDVARNMRLMLREHPDARAGMYVGAVRLLLGRDGWLRPMWPAYRAWYRSDFHPWAFDNRDLLARYSAKLAAAV